MELLVALGLLAFLAVFLWWLLIRILKGFFNDCVEAAVKGIKEGFERGLKKHKL